MFLLTVCLWMLTSKYICFFFSWPSLGAQKCHAPTTHKLAACLSTIQRKLVTGRVKLNFFSQMFLIHFWYSRPYWRWTPERDARPLLYFGFDWICVCLMNVDSFFPVKRLSTLCFTCRFAFWINLAGLNLVGLANVRALLFSLFIVSRWIRFKDLVDFFHGGHFDTSKQEKNKV